MGLRQLVSAENTSSVAQDAKTTHCKKHEKKHPGAVSNCLDKLVFCSVQTGRHASKDKTFSTFITTKTIHDNKESSNTSLVVRPPFTVSLLGAALRVSNRRQLEKDVLFLFVFVFFLEKLLALSVFACVFLSGIMLSSLSHC